MPDLRAPLRVTWDLPADADLAAVLWRRLTEGRVLFAEVLVEPAALSGLEGLVAGLAAGGGPRVTLLGEPEVLLDAREALGPQALAGAELGMLWPFRPSWAVEELAAVTRRVAPSLWSTPAGMEAFAEALEIARGYGLTSVWVLNPPAPAPALGPADREAAATTWRERGCSKISLRVHDLFLAEALGLDPFAGYRGCQAGEALAHLTAQGALTACRTLPVVLGDLTRTPLAELWQAGPRGGLRRELASSPDACASCALVSPCAGGCRGLATPRDRDPSCPGARPGPAPAEGRR